MRLTAIWLKLITLAAAKKGIIMEIHNKRNHLYRIIIFLTMLLFAACLTMNVFLCSNYDLCQLLDKNTVIETCTISEKVIANEIDHDTAYFNSLFLDKNTLNTETVTKNICPILIIAVIHKGHSLLLFRIIVFPFFFLISFILLSDRWTLVNQKIRLDI